MNACAEVLEKSINNETIIVSAPVNNLISTDSIQTFYWEKVNGATSYELQIVSPIFDSIKTFVTDTTVQTNLFLFSLSSGQYQWRVSAKNLNSATPFSEPRNLTIN